MPSSAPTRIPDLPVSIVIVCIYFTCALCMIGRLLQSHKKFRIGGLLIGLCMSRVVTFAVRAAWSTHPSSRNLAIASTVFLNAGVVLLIVTNMQLVIRLAKSLRPELQESTFFRRGTTAAQFFIIPLLIMTIAPAIMRILSTDSVAIARETIVIKISSTYLTIYSCLPLFLAPLIYMTITPSPRSIATRLHWKVVLIMFVSIMVGLEECVRCVNNYIPATIASWYEQKYSFYIFTPMLELLSIVSLILINLPHSFGDSNCAVLDVINGFSSDGKLMEESINQEQELQAALKATTSTYRPGRWTNVH